MSEQICNCADPRLGNTGEPNCAVVMKAMAFPILMPRYGSDGTRNTIDVTSPTLGQDLIDKLNAADPRDRIYPLPRVENPSFPRTDTQYEESESQRKYKLEGVGGIRTWMMQLWASSASASMHRELKKFGCVELDTFYVDISGNLFGIKDNETDTELKGYELADKTFDVFSEYPTPTSVKKLMVSWDLDSQVCEENSYYLGFDELGYKATTLKGILTALQALTEPADGTVNQVVTTIYGSAKTLAPVLGLSAIAGAAVELFNVTQDTAMTAPTGWAPVAGMDGHYTFNYLTAEAATNDVIRVRVTGSTGYDVEDQTFTHTY